MHWSDPRRWKELLAKSVEAGEAEVRATIRNNALEEAAKAVEATSFAAGTLTGVKQADLKRRAAEAIRSLRTNTNPKREGK